MCLVSSYPLLFKLIPYNFGLSASFYPISRHPREGGEPSYSECCSSVLPLRYRYCCWFCFMLLSVVASAFSNVTSGVCGGMDSRVHGNDDGWRGGGALIFYGIVSLLMCLVSSYPLLFNFLLYNFGLLASFYLSVRHPRERGDPSYSECCSSVLPLRYRYCCWFCFMLLSVVASAFPNATSGVRG